MVGERGFSLVEVGVAVVLVTIIAAVAFGGDTRQLQHIAQSFAETKASRLASSRMETLRADSQAPGLGATEFAFDQRATDGLRDIVGSQSVKRIASGLFEIEVEVSWLATGTAQRRRVRLVTWMDWEERR